jgi:hypothetical protein
VAGESEASLEGYFKPKLERSPVRQRRVGVGVDHVLNIRLHGEPTRDLGKVRQLDCP